MGALLVEPMAKQQNESVRLDAELMRKARIIAAIRGVPLSTYLADSLRPVVERDYPESLAKESKGLDKPRR